MKCDANEDVSFLLERMKFILPIKDAALISTVSLMLKRMVGYLVCLCCLLSAIVITAPAQALEKHALVIGNANYEVGALKNPRNDAQDVAAALKGLGYQLHNDQALIDLDRATMEDVLASFARGLDEIDIALVFYAGHGISSKQRNYLVPIGADIKWEAQLPERSLSVDSIAGLLAAYNHKGLNIILLDACRDNPLANSFGRSGTRGLVRNTSLLPRGSFIGYAADQNQTAGDGLGRNGVYTTELLYVLENHSSDPIDVAHRRLAERVVRQTMTSAQPQFPVADAKYIGDYCFGECGPDANAQQIIAEQAEAARRRAEAERMAIERKRKEAEQVEVERKRKETDWKQLQAAKLLYKNNVRQHILAYWVSPNLKGASQWSCDLRIQTIPDGQVIGVEVDNCNAGGASLIRSIKQATFKASPLPLAPNSRLVEEALEISLTAQISAPSAKPYGRLWVTTEPSDARVRIMNIVSKYKNGIQLELGQHFDILVAKKGYNTSRQWVEMSVEEQRINVVLKPRLEIAQPIYRSFEPEMINIPAGTFRMGCLNNDSDCFDDEKPAHQVSVHAFKLGKTEVTFAQYDAYAEATGTSRPSDGGWGRKDRPVINVSWDDARDYIKWLNTETGKNYRLPSEAEWEYAARAGSSSKFSWGNAIDRRQANYGKDGCCGGHVEGSDQWLYTAPVGQFPSNAWGLKDMHGNVWEWVQDSWHDSYRGAPTTGSSRVTKDEYNRVIRSGGWGDRALYLRSSVRGEEGKGSRFNRVGFRLAEGSGS